MRYLTILNGIICLGIALRLIFPHLEAGRMRPSFIAVTILLALAMLAVSVSAFFQFDTAVINLSEVLINAEIAIAIYAVRGNVAELFHVIWGKWDGVDRRSRDPLKRAQDMAAKTRGGPPY